MNETLPAALQETLAHIRPVTEDLRIEAHRRLDQLTKPPGSLGRLEAIAVQCHTIAEGSWSAPLRKAAYVFAADHGVTQEGVSAYPSAVTAQMVENFLRGGAAINVLARLHGVHLTIIDVGVDADFPTHSALWQRKVRRSSRNLRIEPAMSSLELADALKVGLEAAEDAHSRDMHLVAAGEMGIGNTTAASALAAALTRQSVEALTGTGTGISSTARQNKQQVIREALDRHLPQWRSETVAPLEALRCVGGLEIAAMTGFFLGAARHRKIIVVDGFIATAAAALAVALAPPVRDYLLAGHRSEEPGHTHLLEHIGITPILDLHMRLGEGTGAVLAMPVVASALHILTEMATFASAGVSTAKA
ncbi:MAG: nicotinate-nucleotide--dimethylbenzimidazole phosphoribosyltransferase [Steroidobacteraceae bacterium]